MSSALNKRFKQIQEDFANKYQKIIGGEFDIENEIKKDIFAEIQNSSKNVLKLGNKPLDNSEGKIKSKPMFPAVKDKNKKEKD